MITETGKGRDGEMTTRTRGKDYAAAVESAKRKGVDFDTDFHAQNIGRFMSDLARRYGYHAPKDANGSTGRYFFQVLKRLHDKQ